MTEQARQRFAAAIASQYDLHRELKGGMSRVYVATERELGRQVVVKTLPADLSSDAVERFKREIRLAARLQHPNIVPLLSAGDADGVPYYTMPWVEGASLRDRMQREPVPLSDAIGILRDMARALGAAHANGIVHRDIKPENVLLSSGAALITDFGVARALSAATTARDGRPSFVTGTGIAVGTPAYMAPEQFAADPLVDHRADLYAWGVVAFELLTGRHPFPATTGMGLLQAHMSTKPRAVHDVAPAVPRRLSALVARCLEKDPELRPQHAQDLVDALEVQTPRPGDAAKRRWMLAGAAAAVVVAIGAAIMVKRGGAVATDQRMIAIAPFRVGGTVPALHYLREGLGDLMTPQLHSIPGVTAPSMRVMLEQWRRAAGSTDADIPEDRALQVAAKTGAAQLIVGEIIGTAESVTINARLVRVSDGKELATANQKGRADSSVAFAARIVATLLSVRDGGTVDMVRSVVSANPDAITPFLAGEQSYRRGRYADAARSFASAYEHDTTFGLAALRLTVANGWLVGNRIIPGPWLDRAWQNRARLTGGDAALLLALAGANYPTRRPAREYERDLWTAAERANTAELWYHAGDVPFHRYTLSGDTMSWHRALDAFKRAESLDSSFALSLEHQTTLYLTFGDTAAARAAWQRQRMLDSAGDNFAVTDLIFRVVTGTDQQAIQTIRKYNDRTESPVMFLPNGLVSDLFLGAADERRLPLADAFVTITAAKRKVSTNPSRILEEGSYWLNVGRPRSFAAAPSPDSALIVNTLNVIAAVLWDGDSATATRSAPALAHWAAAPPPPDANVLRSTGLFATGLWALSRADTAGVERARASLRAMPAPQGSPLQSTAAVHEKLLAANLAVARKAPDARRKLDELDSLLMDTPAQRDFAVGLGNVMVSRMWEAVGDDQRAWQSLSRQHVNLGATAFASARLRARARIAERLGRTTDAVHALRTFVAVRAKADPPYQKEVARARETLARLERHGTGG